MANRFKVGDVICDGVDLKGSTAMQPTACPFCDGKYTLSTRVPTEGNEHNAWLLHTLPPCEEYNDKDVMQFLLDAKIRKRQNAHESNTNLN